MWASTARPTEPMNMQFKKAHQIYSECVSHGNYDCGIEELDRLILEGVDIQRSLQLRSHLHHLAGNPTQAMLDLNLAIEQDPESGGLYYDRGVLHQHQSAYHLALKDFCEAVHFASAAGDDDLIDAAEHHFIELLENMRSA